MTTVTLFDWSTRELTWAPTGTNTRSTGPFSNPSADRLTPSDGTETAGVEAAIGVDEGGWDEAGSEPASPQPTSARTASRPSAGSAVRVPRAYARRLAVVR